MGKISIGGSAMWRPFTVLECIDERSPCHPSS